MSKKLLLVFLPLFLIVLIGCGDPITQPTINRAAGPANERDTYMSRTVWFPIEYAHKGKAEVESVDLEKLFQKVNDWIVGNEDSISSYTVDVVNATVFEPASTIAIVVPSGVLITYTLKK